MGQRFHKNIRMQDWDYAQSAVYMVTVCVADRSFRLGDIDLNGVGLCDAGRMVSQEILALQERHTTADILEHVVMPNHVHILLGINLAAEEDVKSSLSDSIGEFKSRTTNRYIRGVKRGLLPSFDKRLWQEGYYETVMRDEEMTEERRLYIINNPSNWQSDPDLEGKV